MENAGNDDDDDVEGEWNIMFCKKYGAGNRSDDKAPKRSKLKYSWAEIERTKWMYWNVWKTRAKEKRQTFFYYLFRLRIESIWSRKANLSSGSRLKAGKQPSTSFFLWEHSSASTLFFFHLLHSIHPSQSPISSAVAVAAAAAFPLSTSEVARWMGSFSAMMVMTANGLCKWSFFHLLIIQGYYMLGIPQDIHVRAAHY